MSEFKITRYYGGYPIQASICLMPHDIHILLVGGQLAHIGSIDIFEKGKVCSSIQLEGHKDGVISQRWAQRLSEELACKVIVNCGIHYDEASARQLKDIVSVTELMLVLVEKKIKEEQKDKRLENKK